ncbi:MAG: hypothetical protein J2P34_00250, partial [Actinobacteria bacterium]|nr:hypothetical protein [Actinomycetota bacterium]
MSGVRSGGAGGGERHDSGHDEGVFRWPASGLPRLFGQSPPPAEPAGPGAAGAGPAPGWVSQPFPPRVTLAPQAPYPEPPAGRGYAGEPAAPSVAYGLPDGYDAVDDYDAADAYGPGDYEAAYEDLGAPAAGPGAEPAGAQPRRTEPPRAEPPRA